MLYRYENLENRLACRTEAVCGGSKDVQLRPRWHDTLCNQTVLEAASERLTLLIKLRVGLHLLSETPA